MSEIASAPEGLPPHLQRVFTEHAELCIRLGKLEDFLNSEKSNVLSLDELGRMRRQATYMHLYADVLGERMAAWTKQHQEA